MAHALPSWLVMHTRPAAEKTIEADPFRFTVITPSLIRIEKDSFTDEATLQVISRSFCTVPDVGVVRDGDLIRIDTGVLTLTCDTSLPPEEGLTVRREEAPAFLWHYRQKPLHGLKGTTSTLDNVNGSCPLEDGVCSIDGFAFIDDSRTPIMRGDGWFSPREKGEDIYFFGYGHDYAGAVRDLMRLTGSPGLLPAFVFGCWWSRYHAYSDREYLALMDRFIREDIPLSVAVIDMDWHLTGGDGRDYHTDGWTGYTWNRELFPDGEAFLSALHARGLKTALNLHPALGVRPWDDAYEEMCLALGRDPKEKKPVPFNCLSPAFLKAYFEVLHFPLEKEGVDFWWIDWQQGTDHREIAGDSYTETGLDGISPLWMLNHMHYLASGREGKRPLIFSRFAGIGSQRYPIGFSGDTYITWESLRFQPYFTATASNCGYTWWSHDIGGHMGGVRDDEMTVRWIQLGVFSPIFRLHSTDSPFLGREPWNYNRRAEEIIARFMRLRRRLFPYLYTMNRRTAEECLPLVRPMYHLCPELPEAYRVPNEYLFGSEMIAAPITDKTDESDLACAVCFLPEGIWTDAFNGWVYRGGKVIRAFRPQEEMPLFLKAGAIVPLLPHVPHAAGTENPAVMDICIAPGASNVFTLYEDDGVSLDWQRGVFSETRMEFVWEEDHAVFAVGPASGGYTPVPERTWVLHFRGFSEDCVFRCAGKLLPGEWDAAAHTHTVILPAVPTDTGISVTVSCAGGLTHPGSDARQRILDRITRAQDSQEEKAYFLKLTDEALARISRGLPLRGDWCGSSVRGSLGGYIREILTETIRG